MRGITCAVVLAAWWAAAAERPPGGRPDRRPPSVQPRSVTRSWNRYREIVARNIFSRDRRPYRALTQTRTPEAPKPDESRMSTAAPGDPGRAFVLVGVSRVGEGRYAFFENTYENTMTHVAVGDTIAERTITAMTLDRVECRHGGKTTRIPVGRTLTGEEAAARASATGPPPPTETVSGPGTTDGATSPHGEAAQPEKTPSADETSILQRLMQRRREEQAQ